MDLKSGYLNFKEAKKTGIFISGISGSGKTNLAKLIADELMEEDFIIKIFDNSQAWQTSNVPSIIFFEEPTMVSIIDYKSLSDHTYNFNVVFDISLLYQYQQEGFIGRLIKEDMEKAIRNRPDKVHIYFFEESQIYLPEGTMRRKAKKNTPHVAEVKRLISVGRNYKMRYGAITPFCALLDKNVIRLCGQKYIGRADEPNDKRYLSNWIGDLVDNLDSLKMGEFYYKIGGKISKIQTPEHKQLITPKMVTLTEKKKSFWDVF